MAGVIATLTISGTNYSVYALTSDALDDANDYFAAHIDAAEWTAATDDTKKKALVSSFRMIEREIWSGSKLVSSQPTQWPRTGATKNGEVVADGIPDDIVLGEFEFALVLLKNAKAANLPNTASNIKSVGAGSAQVEFFYPLTGTTLRWPLPVNDLLAPYLAGSAAGVDIITPYVGGADDSESDFTSLDADRSEGFA